MIRRIIDGSFYDEVWKDDKRKCRGKYTSANGAVYDKTNQPKFHSYYLFLFFYRILFVLLFFIFLNFLCFLNCFCYLG